MINKSVTLGLISSLLLAGCSKTSEPTAHDRLASSAPAVMRQETAGSNSDRSRRFVAVRHKLVIETPEAELPKVWESAGQFCLSIRCEIISSSINNKTQDSPPSGSLSVRVAPEDLTKLFDHLGKAGGILQHVTESEDRTGTVIDVEAKIKNLTGFRNRLRAMLATHSASLKDVIEVERELSRVQAELDGFTTRRRVLANETEKVAVEIDFRSKRSIARTGILAPIAVAWQDAGSVLSVSIANLITFIVAVIPWLLLVVPAFWIVVKLFRRLFRKKTESKERD